MTSLTVNVRGPVVETCAPDVVDGTSLRTDDGGHSMYEGIVKCGAHEDGLGKGGRGTEVARGAEVDSGASSNAVLEDKGEI